ncbi:MAG: cytochrome b/b6 domain-containing protein [Steroidobacteraceae bacterium]|jgi:cytochrome b
MSSSDRKVLVWDAPTRLFHWVVVTLVVAAYVTWRLNWMDWHAKAGYALLTSVLFRILWGFFGSETALFSRFLGSPRAAARHLAHVLQREPDRQAGHNPAGGWMVLLLVLLLIGETLSGVYVANDVADEGPFTELMPAPIGNAITALHGIFWSALLAAVALHLVAIAVYAVVKGHNLLLPMITGWKTLPRDVPRPRVAGPARAAILLICSALAVAVLANVL